MAPRLPDGISLQMGGPVSWPVWLLCTSITLAMFSVVALFAYSRVQAAEERRRREQEQKQNPQYEVMWSFPEKEDKAARFRRWAEVLRFKPREARPPITGNDPRLDVKVALEVFYREAEAAGIAGAPAPLGDAAPVDHHALTIESEVVAEVLRERVKERILQFLIECGPPKGLCVIKEEDRSAPSTPAARKAQQQLLQLQQQHSHLVDMRKLMEAAASNPSTPRGTNVTASPHGSTPSTPSRASPRPPPALALDGEPVLRTETGETVTRELLWAVLARIHAEAALTAAAPAPTPSNTSASAAPCASEGDSLKQPLLGEWKNPLQGQ